jgi:hypothetical protein
LINSHSFLQILNLLRLQQQHTVFGAALPASPKDILHSTTPPEARQQPKRLHYVLQVKTTLSMVV